MLTNKSDRSDREFLKAEFQRVMKNIEARYGEKSFEKLPIVFKTVIRKTKLFDTEEKVKLQESVVKILDTARKNSQSTIRKEADLTKEECNNLSLLLKQINISLEPQNQEEEIEQPKNCSCQTF